MLSDCSPHDDGWETEKSFPIVFYGVVEQPTCQNSSGWTRARGESRASHTRDTGMAYLRCKEVEANSGVNINVKYTHKLFRVTQITLRIQRPTWERNERKQRRKNTSDRWAILRSISSFYLYLRTFLKRPKVQLWYLIYDQPKYRSVLDL